MFIIRFSVDDVNMQEWIFDNRQRAENTAYILRNRYHVAVKVSPKLYVQPA